MGAVGAVALSGRRSGRGSPCSGARAPRVVAPPRVRPLGGAAGVLRAGAVAAEVGERVARLAQHARHLEDVLGRRSKALPSPGQHPPAGHVRYANGGGPSRLMRSSRRAPARRAAAPRVDAGGGGWVLSLSCTRRRSA